MQISEVMTHTVVAVRQSETADVAARLLSRNNIGALPVCDDGGRLVGMLTDRDLVTRCMAAGHSPKEIPVGQIMTADPLWAQEEDSVEEVSAKMGRRQIRRVPVIRDGAVTGIVSLGDLARKQQTHAAKALEEISQNISRR